MDLALFIIWCGQVWRETHNGSSWRNPFCTAVEPKSTRRPFAQVWLEALAWLGRRIRSVWASLSSAPSLCVKRGDKNARMATAYKCVIISLSATASYVRKGGDVVGTSSFMLREERASVCGFCGVTFARGSLSNWPPRISVLFISLFYFCVAGLCSDRRVLMCQCNRLAGNQCERVEWRSGNFPAALYDERVFVWTSSFGWVLTCSKDEQQVGIALPEHLIQGFVRNIFIIRIHTI